MFDLELNKKIQLDVGISLNCQLNQDFLGNLSIGNNPTSKPASTTINDVATLCYNHLGHPSISIIKKCHVYL